MSFANGDETTAVEPYNVPLLLNPLHVSLLGVFQTRTGYPPGYVEDEVVTVEHTDHEKL